MLTQLLSCSVFSIADFPKLSELGKQCPDISLQKANERMGFYPNPWENIEIIIVTSFGSGICTTHTRNNSDSWAQWIVEVGRALKGDPR